MASGVPTPLSSQPGDLVCRIAALILCGLALAAVGYSFERWGDVQIDFGRELYIPWQLAQGRVLYRDVAFFNGPLSPYANALLFWLLPPSIPTLVAANIGNLGATLLCLWKLVRTQASPAAALAGLALFLAATAGNAATGIANYNSLTPYSHEITHGLLLLYGGALALARFVRSPSGPGLGLCGLCVGLALLTKPETALAVSLGVGGGGLLAIRACGPPCPGRRVLAGWLTAGSLLPPACALAALSLAMPFPEALSHLSLMWRMLAMPEITRLPFYQDVTGLGSPGRNLLLLGQSLLVNATVAGYIACLAHIRPVFGRLPGVLADAAPVGLLLATYVLMPQAARFALAALLPRCWPLLLPAALAALAWRLCRTDKAGRPALVPAVAFCLAAWVLTAKIPLNAAFFHYGALLLAPAATAWATAMVGFFPRLFPIGPKRDQATACALAACLVLPWPLVSLSAANLSQRATRVASPRGTMLTDRRGEAIAAVLDGLGRHARPGETLAVLPEGAMLNFLAGLPNPTPYITLMPPEWLTFGEEQIEAAYRTHPPDWVVLLHRDTREYGYGYFCQAYGQSLCRFLREHYDQEAVVGAVPLQDNRYGALVLRRKGAAGAADSH